MKFINNKKTTIKLINNNIKKLINKINNVK